MTGNSTVLAIVLISLGIALFAVFFAALVLRRSLFVEKLGQSLLTLTWKDKAASVPPALGVLLLPLIIFASGVWLFARDHDGALAKLRGDYETKLTALEAREKAANKAVETLADRMKRFDPQFVLVFNDREIPPTGLKDLNTQILIYRHGQRVPEIYKDPAKPVFVNVWIAEVQNVAAGERIKVKASIPGGPTWESREVTVPMGHLLMERQ